MFTGAFQHEGRTPGRATTGGDSSISGGRLPEPATYSKPGEKMVKELQIKPQAPISTCSKGMAVDLSPI